MRARAEDMADTWLRKHDPYYTDKGAGKRKRASSYYETPEMEKRRREMEIPLSNLTLSQAWEIGAVEYKDGRYQVTDEF